MPSLQSSRRLVAPCVVLAASVVALNAGAASGQGGPPATPPLSPAITDIEADWAGKGRIRLHAQVVPRGAKVEKVVFRYRGKRFTATHTKPWDYAKIVKARGDDSRGDKVFFKVRACTETACSTRSGRDVAN